MKATLWGTRGSLAAAGPDTVAYGGDTSSVEVMGSDGTAIVLDAGSGIRRLGSKLGECGRVDVLLTHLHMDHIQGLGFFAPVFSPTTEVHVWGPGATTATLEQRLSRYLSPPLFPVRLRELEGVVVHDLTPGSVHIGSIEVTADLVCHPGLTFGYRLTDRGRTLAYLPDHEPALGARTFPMDPEWTSGFALMEGADVLIHDAQYTDEEYAARRGWGHSSFAQVGDLAEQAGVGRLVTFHHDPGHDDTMLDAVAADLTRRRRPFELIPGKAGTTLEV